MGHYKRGNLVGHAKHLRPLNCEEREVLMGFPRQFTSPLPTKSRLSALGNAWHLRSILVFLMAMTRSVEASCCHHSNHGFDSMWAHQHCFNTVWDSSWSPAQCTTGEEWLTDALTTLEDVPFPSEAVQQAMTKMRALDAAPLLAFSEERQRSYQSTCTHTHTLSSG